MYVCLCHAVKEAEIKAAAKRGCGDLEPSAKPLKWGHAAESAGVRRNPFSMPPTSAAVTMYMHWTLLPRTWLPPSLPDPLIFIIPGGDTGSHRASRVVLGVLTIIR